MSIDNLDGGFFQLHLPTIHPYNNIMQLAPHNRLNPLLDNIYAKYNELCRKYKQRKQELKELKEKEEKLEKREEKLKEREKELKEREEKLEKKIKASSS